MDKSDQYNWAFAVVTVIVVLFIGYSVLSTVATTTPESVEECNEEYGEGNWTFVVNGTETSFWIGQNYECVPKDRVEGAQTGERWLQR